MNDDICFVAFWIGVVFLLENSAPTWMCLVLGTPNMAMLLFVSLLNRPTPRYRASKKGEPPPSRDVKVSKWGWFLLTYHVAGNGGGETLKFGNVLGPV